jgi:hypothetical protein
MINFFCGVAIGFFVATYGVAGVAQALDKGIETVKSVQITAGK